MDYAQQRLDKNKQSTFHFVVDEIKQPVGLLGKDELNTCKQT